MDPRIAELVEHHAISRLQATYGDAVTRRAWSELAGLFTADATITLDLHGDAPIELVGGEAMASFIAGAVERFELFEFALLNGVATLDPGLVTATGRMYIWEIRQPPDGAWTNAFGLYRDRYVRVGDDWCFASRRYSTIARSSGDGATLPPMVVFPLPLDDS